ncbi:unnamed protein product [Rotaria magnacalcarata]|uniref:HMG box domain-containing protein n=2 Tax=Rotaria magnacalcarata TaxID=392030 RepID=A0A8S2MFQ7_9BILA|nr:unnamed protein product [Rotaria magnacalcarata]
MVSTTIQTKDLHVSNTDECPSQLSMNSKRNIVIDDEINKKIKVEDGTDEVKIFSASSIDKHESDDDVDIEDRLSPVVEEPASPSKTDTLNNNIPGLYASPFLYPYFHPYFMAATAQMNSSTDKLSLNGQMNSLFGATPSFPGMPFFPFYPPGMMNQSFQPNLFNPFGVPPPPGVQSSNSSHRQHQSSINTESQQRARIIEECTLKESSAINKILGQKWKELTRSEQDRYYELAKEERNRHMQMYPNWSARDNYGMKKKRPNGPIQKHTSHENNQSPQKSLMNTSRQVDNDCLNLKKCRARYGLEGLSQWCKHCRRKKKCTKFLEDDSSNPKTSGNPSSVSSPGTFQSDDDNSLNEADSDDILSRQIDSIEDEHDDSNDENKQQFYRPPETLPLQFLPNFHY